MKFQYNLLPTKLNIEHTYQDFEIPLSYPEIKKIGPCKVYGFLKKEYEEVITQLDIECDVVLFDFINSKEVKTKLDFELDLLFSNTSKKADYSLEDLNDFDQVILGNILLEIPISITERGEE